MDHLGERTFRLRSGPKVLNPHTARVSIFPRKSAQKGITGMFLSGAPMGTTWGMGILDKVPFSSTFRRQTAPPSSIYLCPPRVKFYQKCYRTCLRLSFTAFWFPRKILVRDQNPNSRAPSFVSKHKEEDILQLFGVWIGNNRLILMLGKHTSWYHSS